MTAFLLALCLTSTTSRLLFSEKRLIRCDRAFVVANSRRTTSPLSRHYCLRRWRCQTALHRKKRRLLLSSSVSPAFPFTTARNQGFLGRTASTLPSHTSAQTTRPAINRDHLISPIDLATVEHLFELSSGAMEGSLPQAAPLSRPRLRSREGTISETVGNSCFAATTAIPASMLRSSAMPPPPLSLASSVMSMPIGAANAGDGDQDDGLATRPSRSASIASRSNRLSLTLPIALPNGFSTRPMPSSATITSFPSTPVDISSVLANPSDPVDVITAIAAQERQVLELREDLLRAEAGLAKLKKHWQTHEIQRKRAESRRSLPLRQLSTRSVAASPATETGPVSASSDLPASDFGDSAEARRSSELDKRKALLLNQQAGSVPSTPVQSKRRVFTGRHTRALSLLSPTGTVVSDDFSIHQDQTDDEGFSKSPASSQEPDSPFCQGLSRYAPKTAVQLSKRSSWAPQSVHQATGFKQVAGDLSATLWTFVEDLRQATVGDEPFVHRGVSATRNGDSNSRAGPLSDEDQQSTIRASTNGTARSNLARAFTADMQSTPTPAYRSSNLNDQGSNDSGAADAGSSKTKLSRSGSKKTNKRFSYTPLTVDAYDDNDWSSWESPTVKSDTVKSPRWSGSTMNEDVSLMKEQADEIATTLNNDGASSPSSPSAKKANDIAWSALTRLAPGNIKRTATDLMKEWEKSLTMPPETTMDHDAASNMHM